MRHMDGCGCFCDRPQHENVPRHINTTLPLVFYLVATMPDVTLNPVSLVALRAPLRRDRGFSIRAGNGQLTSRRSRPPKQRVHITTMEDHGFIDGSGAVVDGWISPGYPGSFVTLRLSCPARLIDGSISSG